MEPFHPVAAAARFLDQAALHACRQASRGWREAADGAAWENLSVPGAQFTPASYALALRACGPATRRVSLNFCRRLTSRDLAQLGGAVPGLEELQLNGCHNVGSLAPLAASVRRPLRALSLYWNPQLDDAALAEARPLVGGLRRLGLAGVRHVTGEGLAALLEAVGPALEDLDLTRVERLDDAALETVGRRFPRLRVLRMYAVSAYSDRGVLAVAAGCPLLQCLDMTGAAVGLSDEGVRAVARGCPRLAWLALTWCTQLGDESLRALGAGNTRALEHLSLHGNALYTDAGLEALAAGCPRVQFLDLNGCTGITRRGEDDARALFPMLRKVASL